VNNTFYIYFYFAVNVIKSDYLLVCWVCKLIIEGGAEELDEHMAKDHEFDDTPNRYVYLLQACKKNKKSLTKIFF